MIWWALNYFHLKGIHEFFFTAPLNSFPWLCCKTFGGPCSDILSSVFTFQLSQSYVSAKYIYYGQDIPVCGSAMPNSPLAHVKKVSLSYQVSSKCNCLAILTEGIKLHYSTTDEQEQHSGSLISVATGTLYSPWVPWVSHHMARLTLLSTHES